MEISLLLFTNGNTIFETHEDMLNGQPTRMFAIPPPISIPFSTHSNKSNHTHAFPMIRAPSCFNLGLQDTLVRSWTDSMIL